MLERTRAPCPKITLQSRLALDPRVRFRRFENDGIVIHQKTAEAMVVSDVATRLLEMTDGTRTLRNARAIQSEFDAPRRTSSSAMSSSSRRARGRDRMVAVAS